MADVKNITYVDFVNKQVIAPPMDNDIDEIIRTGFNRYLLKYEGQPIDQNLIFNLCKDILGDAIATIRKV